MVCAGDGPGVPVIIQGRSVHTNVVAGRRQTSGSNDILHRKRRRAHKRRLSSYAVAPSKRICRLIVAMSPSHISNRLEENSFVEETILDFVDCNYYDDGPEVESSKSMKAETTNELRDTKGE